MAQQAAGLLTSLKPSRRKALRVRQKLGKYRIESKLGAGSFAAVYAAMDTVEGRRVALKIPHNDLLGESTLNDFAMRFEPLPG